MTAHGIVCRIESSIWERLRPLRAALIHAQARTLGRTERVFSSRSANEKNETMPSHVHVLTTNRERQKDLNVRSNLIALVAQRKDAIEQQREVIIRNDRGQIPIESFDN